MSKTVAKVSALEEEYRALSDAELTFWMHAYGVAIGTLDVGVSTDGGVTFTNLLSWSGAYQSASADPYVPVAIDLTSYLGQAIYVGFTYTKGASWSGDLAIDLVRVEACASCAVPTSLTASNIKGNSADLGWTVGGTETACK